MQKELKTTLDSHSATKFHSSLITDELSRLLNGFVLPSSIPAVCTDFFFW